MRLFNELRVKRIEMEWINGEYAGKNKDEYINFIQIVSRRFDYIHNFSSEQFEGLETYFKAQYLKSEGPRDFYSTILADMFDEEAFKRKIKKYIRYNKTKYFKEVVSCSSI